MVHDLSSFSEPSTTDELLFLTIKNTDTVIEKTKTRPQKTFEFIFNKSRDTFTIITP